MRSIVNKIGRRLAGLPAGVKMAAVLLLAFWHPAKQYCHNATGFLEGIHTGYYHVGYDTGFGGRKFVGTVCNLLFFKSFTPPYSRSIRWGIASCRPYCWAAAC